MEGSLYFFSSAKGKITKLVTEKTNEMIGESKDFAEKLVTLLMQDHGYDFILDSIEQLVPDIEESTKLADWVCSLREKLDRSGNEKKKEAVVLIYGEPMGIPIPGSSEEHFGLLTPPYSLSPSESPCIFQKPPPGRCVGYTPNYNTYRDQAVLTPPVSPYFPQTPPPGRCVGYTTDHSIIGKRIEYRLSPYCVGYDPNHREKGLNKDDSRLPAHFFDMKP